jgi:tetratricopeptide (TPR) repeat protein
MRTLTLALCAALVATGLGASPSPWVEIKSAHFTVITNSGDKTGRRTAWQFEQMRAALARLWPWAKIDSGRPFLVFAVKDEATLKTLGPQYWEGKQFRPVSFGVGGRDKQFVALRTDVREPDEISANPYRTAYWSYVSTVFTRSFPGRLPEWYSRGIAEVMSNTFVREKEVHVGRLIQGNLDIMRERASIPLNEFLSAQGRSPWLTQEDSIRLFDAQAWALVHYLLFGEEGKQSERLDRFNRLLYSGAEAETALKEAFGDMTPYYVGMRAYITRGLFSYARIPVSLESRSETFTTRAVPAAEAAVLCGEFLVAMGRPAEARAFAAEAKKADASLSGPWEIEGRLFDAEGRPEEAKAAFAKAVEAGSKNGYIHYRLAQLEWVPSADRQVQERLAARLEAARALDPDAANTLSFLAEVRSSLGDNEEALKLAIRAVQIAPAETYHRMALVRILWALRRPDEAIRMAQSALQTAHSEAERRQVQQFLDFAAKR